MIEEMGPRHLSEELRLIPSSILDPLPFHFLEKSHLIDFPCISPLADISSSLLTSH